MFQRNLLACACRRIIIARPDRIGDVIVSTACLGPLRERFPHAQIAYLVRPEVKDLFEEIPYADRLLFLPPAGETFWRRVRLLTHTLREMDADALVLLHPNRLVALAAWHAGIPVRIGFESHRPHLMTHALPMRKHLGEKHECRYAFDLLDLLGVEEPEDISPAVSPLATARQSATAKLAPHNIPASGYAAFHLTAFGKKARVPLDLAIRTAQWLRHQFGWKIVLIGSEAHDPAVDAFRAALQPPAPAPATTPINGTNGNGNGHSNSNGNGNGKVNGHGHGRSPVNGNGKYGASGLGADDFLIDLTGSTNLSETAWVLQGAQLFFGRDSGPAHLAAAMGCPTVTLFGTPRPVNCARRWSPIGPQSVNVEKWIKASWWENTEKKSARNLRRIALEEIQNAVFQALGIEPDGAPGPSPAAAAAGCPSRVVPSPAAIPFIQSNGASKSRHKQRPGHNSGGSAAARQGAGAGAGAAQEA